jgi:cell division transport system ATP-binding protein
MIELQGVSKRYGGREALTEVGFALPRGSLTFLTGHSGAGKSTLLRLLLRLELATRGSVRVGGLDLARMKARAVPRYRQQVGAVFQDPQLLADRCVFDNVALPLLIAGYREEDRARRVRAALSRVDLLDKERQTPEQLSTGERQRVGIARAVVNRPAVLLADEPTGNLDPRLSEEIMGLFRLFQQVGVTVLIATHDLDLVERFGERVLELSRGRLVADAPGREPVAPVVGEDDDGGL